MTLGTKRSGPPHGPEETAVDLLVACHERIRRFSELSVQFATVANPKPEELVDAVRGVVRYFTVALPLHVEDEDLSVMPRLTRAASAEVDRALVRMADEHRSIEALLATLVPRWQTLANEPGRLAEWAGDLHRDGVLLRAALEGHLLLEERAIFPALAALAPELQAEVSEEMRRRRT